MLEWTVERHLPFVYSEILEWRYIMSICLGIHLPFLAADKSKRGIMR